MVRAKLCVRTCTTSRRLIPARGPSGSDGRIKPRRELRYRRSLIYKLPVFRWTGATARYSHCNVPVETGTPPYRRSNLHIPRFRLKPKARSFRCVSSPNRTRLRWASVWLAASPPNTGGFFAKSAQLRFRLTAKTAPAPLLLLSKPDPLALGSGLGNGCAAVYQASLSLPRCLRKNSGRSRSGVAPERATRTQSCHTFSGSG